MMRVRALLPTVALTVGLLAGNAAAAFTGQSDITRTQAVSVLVSLGVLNGKSDGTFEPDGPVTAREAAKMLLTAGYSAEKEGLTGTDWVVAVPSLHSISKRSVSMVSSRSTASVSSVPVF